MNSATATAKNHKKKSINFYEFLTELKPRIEKKENIEEFKRLIFSFLFLNEMGLSKKCIKDYICNTEGENQHKEYWRIFSYCSKYNLIEEFKKYSYIVKARGKESGILEGKILKLHNYQKLSCLFGLKEAHIKDESMFIRNHIDYFCNS